MSSASQLSSRAGNLVVGAAPDADGAIVLTASSFSGDMEGSDELVHWDGSLLRATPDGSTADLDLTFVGAVGAGAGGVWALDARCALQGSPEVDHASLVEVGSPGRSRARIGLALPCHPGFGAHIAADDDVIWTALGSRIERVDRSTGTQTTFDVPGPVMAMVATTSSLWVSVAATADPASLVRMDRGSGAVLGRIELDTERLAASEDVVWAIVRTCGAGARPPLGVPCAAPGRLVRIADDSVVDPAPTMVVPAQGEVTTQGAVVLATTARDLWVITQQDWTSPAADRAARHTGPPPTARALRLERRDPRTGQIVSVHELGTRAREGAVSPTFPFQRFDALVPLADGRVLIATNDGESFELHTVETES